MGLRRLGRFLDMSGKYITQNSPVQLKSALRKLKMTDTRLIFLHYESLLASLYSRKKVSRLKKLLTGFFTLSEFADAPKLSFNFLFVLVSKSNGILINAVLFLLKLCENIKMTASGDLMFIINPSGFY